MGWIKLHTKFLEWEWADDPNMVSLFIHLLLMVNYKDKEWHGVTIERGQLATSYEKLKIATGLSVRSLRTCLAKLEQTGEIERKSTKQFTIITICKYESYQDCDQTSDKQPTNERQTSDKQPTTTIEYKNNRNIDIKEKEINKEKERAAFVQTVYDDTNLIQELLSSSTILTICRDYGLTIEQFRRYAETIYGEWQLAGITHPNATQAKSHMLYTIRIRSQKDSEQRQKNGKTREEWQNELQGEAMRLVTKIYNGQDNATNNIQ